MTVPVVEDEGMACVQPSGSEDQCAACARPSRTTAAKIIPAMYVTFLRMGGEPVWECIHRVHVETIHSFAGVDKPLTLGAVDSHSHPLEGVPT